VIAVLGGLRHPVGPFVGAVVFVLLQNFAIDLIDMRERFNLVIGGVFLAIVLFSPDGLLGLWQWFVGWARFGRWGRRLAKRTGAYDRPPITTRDHTAEGGVDDVWSNETERAGGDGRGGAHRDRRGARAQDTIRSAGWRPWKGAIHGPGRGQHARPDLALKGAPAVRRARKADREEHGPRSPD